MTLMEKVAVIDKLFNWKLRILQTQNEIRIHCQSYKMNNLIKM